MVRSLPACRIHRAERELSPHAVLCASFSPESPERFALYSEPSAGVNGWSSRVSLGVRTAELSLQTSVAACKLILMPELPDITAYIRALEKRIVGQPLERVRLGSPFLLRTVEPPLASAEGRVVKKLSRVGKRIAIGVDGDLWLVLHLMIAGRLHWKKRDAKLGGRQNLAAFDFPGGSLILTEAGSKKRASLHLIRGE